MKTLPIIWCWLVLWITATAQDGSDIRYLKVSKIKKSLIGSDVHFDFYRRSYMGLAIDTVVIQIDNKPIQFIERRKDDGFNNWFDQQYLQSIHKIDEYTIRIAKCRLDSIKRKSFVVTMYVDFYDDHQQLQASKSRQVIASFNKKDIIEVLVRSKQL